MRYSTLFSRLDRLYPPPDKEIEISVMWGSYECEKEFRELRGLPFISRAEYDAHTAEAICWGSGSDETIQAP